jgi:glycosyltransferase involved in cell wall biosynthesis
LDKRTDKVGMMAIPNVTVSILIPAYNAEAWIDETIKSVLAQTWPLIEVIVVDDGSTDKTFEKALKYKQDNVKVFRQQNKGASAARNKAFMESSGNYIQYLDADDLLGPDKIENQLRSLQNQDKGVIASSAWAMFFDDIQNAQFFPTALWRDFSSPVEWLISAWTGKVWMAASAWLTPRVLIEQAGPWNENLSLHDDGEFFCRVLLKSKGIKFCGEAKAFYRKGLADSLSSQKSLKAIHSHYHICELYEQHLLSIADNAETRNACAGNYQAFIYDHYPAYPELLNKAKKQVKRLNGSSLTPSGSPVFNLLSKIFGWKIARRIEIFAYRNNLTRSYFTAKLKDYFTIKNNNVA